MKNTRIGHVQVQHIRLQPFNGLRQGSPPAQRQRCIDQLQLNRHTDQPIRVV